MNLFRAQVFRIKIDASKPVDLGIEKTLAQEVVRPTVINAGLAVRRFDADDILSFDQNINRIPDRGQSSLNDHPSPPSRAKRLDSLFCWK
jgi:hypothetical protein